MFDPSSYTIGWICALTVEYVAARLFLDKLHGSEGRPESVPRNDNNQYTLGEIAGHNVVIACMPRGQYGISSATSVAKDLIRSFPNVRIGLMVGIGGGAPSEKNDIRLGDVVVSSPENSETHGGVLHYAFGRNVQDQEFKMTGFLAASPKSLLGAVGGLEVKYEMEGQRLEDAIEKALDKLQNQRSRNKYRRPDPENDKLYRSEVLHPSFNDGTCAEVCGDDPSKLHIRRTRETEESEDSLTIHYGLIASADQLMKNALMRDKLAKEKNVLCFEMEAAGLMNHFPCLVIRGICDYSDTHKNNTWQGYAAMAAAAYAKDLLGQIPPTDVENEERIVDVLNGQLKPANVLQLSIKWPC